MASSEVRIYILCHNEERLAEATREFQPYKWAHPILMKYQDCTFENAFWRQLYEIKDEWIHCKMVGTLSAKAGRKVNLRRIDAIIHNSAFWEKAGYYHFASSGKPIKPNLHPHLLKIIGDVSKELGVAFPTENNYNYWMCSPEKMLQFIEWFDTKAKPAVLSHPLAMTDAKYIEGTLTKDQLMKICGISYYPHVPFVFERLNKSFF